MNLKPDKEKSGNDMKSLETYRKNGKDLYSTLQLGTYPVAIKYIESTDQIPKDAMWPSAIGKKITLCQAITLARQWEETVAMTAKDNLCSPSTLMHRWNDLSLEDLVESQVRQGWHKTRAAEESRFAHMAECFGDKDYFTRKRKYIGSICAPLAKTTFIPDSVLFYCNGAQFTRVIHALCYEGKYAPTSTFEGFEESCVKGALMPFLSQKPQVVIPAAGDRLLAGVMEHELGIGMPADLVSYVLENLFKCGGDKNPDLLGLPPRVMLPMNLDGSISPGFKYLWDKMEKKKQG